MFTTTKTRLTALLSFFAAVVIVASSCSKVEELPYETTHEHEALESLLGQKLVLISFNYEQNMIVGDAADSSIGTTIANNHKEYFISAFEPYFEITYATSEGSLQENGPPAVSEIDSIQEIITSTTTDGAILVTNSYGYELSSGDPILLEAASNVVETILETVVSKKAADWFQSLSGPSFVIHYYLVSDTSIVNRNGEVIWRFFGKAAVSPPPLSGTVGEKLESFTRSLAGTDPTEQELKRAMDGIYEPFTDYLVWVLESDIEESTSINYFTDYPAYDEKSPVTIFPALDQTHVPITRTAEEIKKYEEASEKSLWNIAKSADWKVLGQWKQAWAALKLLGITILIGMPLSYLDDKYKERSKGGEGCLTVQFLLLAVSISMLASIYLLLKAIF